MGPEWLLSLDGEPTVSRVDSDNGSHIDDLQLFPDLQDLNKKEYTSLTRSVSKDSFSVNSDECEDDELMGYFTRSDTTVQRSKTSPPAQVQQSVCKTPATGPGHLKPKLKVVTVRQSAAHGGKVLVVQETNRPNECIVKDSKFNQFTISHAGPSSPSSSVEIEDNDSTSGLCMSKNAIAARENRLRKKNHIQILEKSVQDLTSENSTLKTDLTEMKGTIESLQNEVQYLRSVLANQSTLAKLLENIPLVPDITLSKSKDISKVSNSPPRKRPASVDEPEWLDSDDECDCHPQKNVCMCSKENQGQSKSTKFVKRVHTSEGKVNQPDHSYATEDITSKKSSEQPSHKMRTRGHPSANETTGGVCLHVSGSSVSLEFCSSCSHKAAGSRQKVKN